MAQNIRPANVVPVLFVLLSLLFLSVRPVSAGGLPQITTLDGPWFYQYGPIGKFPSELNRWQEAASVRDVPAATSDQQYQVHYRTVLPDTGCRDCSLIIGAYIRSYQIYADDVLLATGNNGLADAKPALGKANEVIRLGPVKPGQTLYISISNRNDPNKLYEPVRFGDSQLLIKERVYAAQFNALVGLLVMLTGLIAGMLYISLRRDASFLFLALCAFNVGLYMLSRSFGLHHFWQAPALFDFLEYFCLGILSLTVWLYMRTVIQPVAWAEFWIFSSTGGMLLWMLYQWMINDKVIYQSITFIQAVLFSGALVVIIALVREAYRGNREARAIIFAFGITAAITGTETFYTMFFNEELGLLPLGGGFFMVSQLFVMTNRFGRMNKELKLYSEGLEQMNAKLKEMNQIKDSILANTSHELRTPLHGMIGLAESLMESNDSFSAPVKNVLKMIVNSGKRLNNLVNDILDFSNMKQRTIDLQLQPVDVAPLIEGVFQIDKNQLGNKPVAWHNKISANTPLIWADESRFMQIIHNLLSNAIKFTEEGKIEAETTWDDRNVSIHIRDTGVGISSAQYSRIFEAFEQGDISVERKYGGTGLGLAITNHLIQLHQGDIRVDSVPGEGSCFTVTLPRAIQHARSIIEENQQVQLNREQLIPGDITPGSYGVNPMFDDDDEEELPPAKALVWCVDDEPVNLQVLNIQLRPAGYGLKLFSNAQDLLNELEQTPEFPELLVVDIMMPVMNGYELTRRVRKMHTQNDLPIIMLTAKSQSKDILEGFEAGANDYVIKPFIKAELLSRIDMQIQMKRQHAEDEQKVVAANTNASKTKEQLQQGFLMFGKTLTVDHQHSASVVEILGLNPAGMPVADLLSTNKPDERNWMNQLLGEIFTQKDGSAIETYLSLLPKEISLNQKTIGVNVQPVLNPQGQLHMFMVILSDLSDQKLLEKRIQSEEQMLHMAVAVLADAEAFNNLTGQYRLFAGETIQEYLQLPESDKPDLKLQQAIQQFSSSFQNYQSFLTVPYLDQACKVVAKHPAEDTADWRERVGMMRWTSPLDVELERLAEVLPDHMLTNQESIPASRKEELFDLKQQILDRLPAAASKKLVDQIEKMYYKPFSHLFEPLAGALQTWSEKLGKPAEALQISGGDWTTDLDSWQKWANALVHLLRAQLEHSVEHPSVRAGAGKPEKVVFRIEIQKNAHEICVLMSDDGIGLWTELRNEDPGFHALEHQLDLMGGLLTIRPVPGKGTEFEFTFPFTS